MVFAFEQGILQVEVGEMFINSNGHVYKFVISEGRFGKFEVLDGRLKKGKNEECIKNENTDNNTCNG